MDQVLIDAATAASAGSSAMRQFKSAFSRPVSDLTEHEINQELLLLYNPTFNSYTWVSTNNGRLVDRLNYAIRKKNALVKKFNRSNSDAQNSSKIQDLRKKFQDSKNFLDKKKWMRELFAYNFFVDRIREYNKNHAVALCVPHMPHLSVGGSLQSGPTTKLKMSIKDAVEHSREKCESNYTYTAIRVQVHCDFTTNKCGHANVLLFQKTGTIWVVEPNGSRELDNDLRNYMDIHFPDQYTVVEHAGVQTRLGIEEKTDDSITREGLPICAGVSWWMVLQFVQQKEIEDFQAFVTQLDLRSKDQTKRLILKRQLLLFFRIMFVYLLKFASDKQYLNSNADRVVQKNMEQQIERELEKEVDIRFAYAFKLSSSEKPIEFWSDLIPLCK